VKSSENDAYSTQIDMSLPEKLYAPFPGAGKPAHPPRTSKVNSAYKAIYFKQDGWNAVSPSRAGFVNQPSFAQVSDRPSLCLYVHLIIHFRTSVPGSVGGKTSTIATRIPLDASTPGMGASSTKWLICNTFMMPAIG